MRSPLLRSACGLLATMALLLSNGCVTQRQVRAIVGQSNAALMEPYLGKPGDQTPGDWKETVQQIDRLIKANADQPQLVNHLRVRQAVVLTVNRQDKLAGQRWDAVERTKLTTMRDRGLYDCHQALVWAYRRLHQIGPLDTEEVSVAQSHVKTLEEVLNGIGTDSTSKSIRIYLGTIQAQIALKYISSSNNTKPEELQARAKELADNLNAYFERFDKADQDWVKQNRNLDSTTVSEMTTIEDFRTRVWLREIILAYQSTAKDMLSGDSDPKPQWNPDWIATY